MDDYDYDTLADDLKSFDGAVTSAGCNTGRLFNGWRRNTAILEKVWQWWIKVVLISSKRSVYGETDDNPDGIPWENLQKCWNRLLMTGIGF
jgi:hypothetical protein